MVRIVFLFVLGLWSVVYAQNAGIDSLKQVIATAKNDSLRASGYCRLCGEYRSVGEYQKGLDAGNEGLKLAEEKQYLKTIAYCLISIGLVHYEQGDPPKALDYYQKSLKINEKVGSQKGISNCYTNMGVLFFQQKSYEKALNYFQKSLAIDEKLGDKAGISTSQINLAVIYSERGDTLKALEYFERSTETFRKMNDKKGVSNGLFNIGALYHSMHNYAKAQDYLERSLRIEEELGDQAGISELLIQIGNNELQLGNAKRAKQSIEKGLKIALEIKNLDQIVRGYEHIHEVDSVRGDYKSSLANYKRFHRYKDSLFNQTKSQELANLEHKFQLENEREQQQRQAESERQRRALLAYLFSAVMLLIMGGTGFIYYRYRSKTKINRLLSERNERIEIQKQELEETNNELNATLEQLQFQKEIIEHKNLKIEDSIHYARQIQLAILPEDTTFNAIFASGGFIYYRPKDIVSGDFYWFSLQESLGFLAVVDCTGHGVPGAFMSVVGHNLLNQIVNEMLIHEPQTILTELDRRVRQTLHQDAFRSTLDGMDVCLCVFDFEQKKLTYAGARRPLYGLMTDGQLMEWKPSPYSVGGFLNQDKFFVQQEIPFNTGDRFYLFSDGITDQFGGNPRKKFTPRRLKEFIGSQSHVSVTAQGDAFRQTMTEWMENNPQLDDLTFIGVEV